MEPLFLLVNIALACSSEVPGPSVATSPPAHTMCREVTVSGQRIAVGMSFAEVKKQLGEPWKTERWQRGTASGIHEVLTVTYMRDWCCFVFEFQHGPGGRLSAIGVYGGY